MNRLKLLREQHGMKQSELGALLNVKDAAISKYESGKIQLTSDTLIQLSEIFGESIDYILGRDDPNSDGIGTVFGYNGEDESAITFPHKLANQIDFQGTKICDLAKSIGVSEKTVLDWLSGNDESYSDYYQALSDYFNVQIRYWTSPHAISPGIEPNMNEYLLILLYRSYKEHGIFDEIYGSLEHYFPGIHIISDDEESSLLSLFRELNEDSRDIIKGELKKVLRSQRYEESIAMDEPQKTGTTNTK